MDKNEALQRIKEYDNYFLPAANFDIAQAFYDNKLGLDIKFDFSERGYGCL